MKCDGGGAKYTTRSGDKIFMEGKLKRTNKENVVKKI